MILKYLLSFSKSFSFSDGFLLFAEVFQFDEVPFIFGFLSLAVKYDPQKITD